MIPGQNETKHPFFFGTSVKSSYIYTDENTSTFEDLCDRNVVTEIKSPTYEEYHTLEKKQQQDVKSRFLKFILPVSMVSLQRRSEFANRIELIILDIDNGDGIAIQELHSILRELDYNHWIYTTISHTPDHPKYRIIVEADGVMTPDLYNQCVVDMASKLNLTIGPPKSNSNIDSTSRDVVHAMFLPAKFASENDVFEEIKYASGKCYTSNDIDWKDVETIVDRLSLSDKDSISYAQPPMEGVSKDMINTVLKQIQHMAVDYEEWLKVGMAIHHQYNGNEEGRDVWNGWSSRYGGEKYDRDDLFKTWNSFSGQRSIDQKAITFRSCFSWAIEQDWKPTLSRDDLTPLFLEIQQLREEDGAHTPEEVRIAIDNLAERIRYTPMAPEHREELILEATACAKQYSLPYNKKYFNNKFAFANILSLTQNQIPNWCKHHIFLNVNETIFLGDKGYAVKESGYNNIYNSTIRDTMPYDPESNTKSTRVKPSPWERALDWYHIPKVDDIRFAPGRDEIFTEKGGTYFNSYIRPKFTIKRREDWNESEKDYIDKLREHLRWMFPDAHIKTILTFLAITIFEPQTKIRWAIFIHSYAQGIGKSLFQGIASTVMGDHLISTVKSKQLNDLSTKWKDNKKLVVVEEANLSKSTLEDLKDDISNNRMVVRSMYKDAIEVPNYVNYIFISNELDGVNIQSEKDRRYYVASSPVQNRADMYARLRYLGIDDDTILKEMQRNHEFGVSDKDLKEEDHITKSAFSTHIFDELFGGLDKYSSAISGWMLEIYQRNKDDFDRTLPKLTDEFIMLARTADSPIQSITEVVINENTLPKMINTQYVLPSYLYDIMFGSNPAYSEYHLSDSIKSKHQIHTKNSLRGYMIRKLQYQDLGTFQYSMNGKKIRHRVLSKNREFIQRWKGQEKEMYEYISNNLRTSVQEDSDV